MMSQESRIKLGQEARNRVDELLDVKAIGEQWQQIIEDLVNDR